MESPIFILGPEVTALEAELAAYLGFPHAISCASGTDALLLPLKALGAEPGSDILIPSFTFFATAGAVGNAGYRPVFCDVDPDTFNVTVETLDAVWTERAVAVIPVHLFGQMAPMGEIRAWARQKGLFILEDTAQAIGARRMYHHEMVGTNSRLDALQAAVLRVKLPYLEGWAAARRENARLYGERLAGVDGIRLPVVTDGNVHVYNQYTLRAERRDELQTHLGSLGIGCSVYYPVPLHLQECFSSLGGRGGDLPVTERLCKEVLSLPIFPELGEERLGTVAEAVRAFYGG